MALPPLVVAIDELALQPFSGEVFRHVAAGRNPRSGRGARTFGGRWNPPDSFAVLYCGFDPATVADEFHRLARRQGLLPQAFLPRELYRLRVELGVVLDLRAAEAQERLSLADTQLRGDDLSACQAVGAAAHSLGVEAILAPSAAGPGATAAIFLDALRPGSAVEVIGLEAVWDEPPEARPREPE